MRDEPAPVCLRWPQSPNAVGVDPADVGAGLLGNSDYPWEVRDEPLGHLLAAQVCVNETEGRRP